MSTTERSTAFAPVEQAIEDIRQGKLVVVVDAADRENEGDLTIAAQFATPEAINFMAKHGRGLICLCLTEERCDELGLRPMTERNETPFGTAFTVSIEAREGISTGISAPDRSRTIQVAIDPSRSRDDLVQPGHVFPLRARPGGVLQRAGQTEAAVDLARLAGLNPAGVVCEIMNDDGTMARVPDLIPYCERHGLTLVTVADLIEYRRRTEKLVERTTSVRLPTAYGEFTAVAFRERLTGKHHLALVHGEVDGFEEVLVRVHSECLTGDVFHSLRCDCGEQLDHALQQIAAEDRGVLLYMAQEGSRNRPAEQAPRVRAAGDRPGHRRGEPRARLPGGCAGVGDREPDPRRPRTLDDPDPDEQPEEDQRARGLWSHRGRAGPDRDAAERREPALPGDQAREARAPAPPPGSEVRLGGGAVSEGLEDTQLWPGQERPPDQDRPEEREPEPEPETEPAAEAEEEELPAEEDELPRSTSAQHAGGELRIPDGYGVIEGDPSGARRSVGVVVGRFNGGITGELLSRALDELERAGVGREAVTVVPVPGAFELPLAAMALAKTRRYSCIVALGAIIRGETPHFEYVASEAASGLQLAGLETGVPVAFGVLTVEDEQQAQARLDKGAEAVRTALEMADVFAQLRAAAGVAAGFGYTRRRVQGLRNLREEAVVRPQPEPFDGGHEAALQPEPPARPHAAERQGDACLRLHALPQGRQGHEGDLTRPGLFARFVLL